MFELLAHHVPRRADAEPPRDTATEAIVPTKASTAWTRSSCCQDSCRRCWADSGSSALCGLVCLVFICSNLFDRLPAIGLAWCTCKGVGEEGALRLKRREHAQRLPNSSSKADPRVYAIKRRLVQLVLGLATRSKSGCNVKEIAARQQTQIYYLLRKDKLNVASVHWVDGSECASLFDEFSFRCSVQDNVATAEKLLQQAERTILSECVARRHVKASSFP